MKQQLTTVGPNTPDSMIHVHRAGCADLKRGIYPRLAVYTDTGEFESLQEIVWDFYPPDNFCYDAEGEWEDYAQEFRIFPCVEDLPGKTD